MKIIQPSVKLWNFTNSINHIARCARVCYASNNISTNSSDSNLVNNLIKNKHLSMFRHVPVYYIIPEKIQIDPKAYIDAMILLVGNKYYVSTNLQASQEYWNKYNKYEISKEEAENDIIFKKNKMLRYTFCIKTGIDITRELNRKSPNNIAEQSTRYVDFNKKIGIVFKHCHWMYGLSFYKKLLIKIMCKTSEWFYKISRSKYGLNLKPQDARWILPLNIMSKVVYTYTVKDWEHIINLRLFDYTGVAHSDVKIIAQKIYDILIKEGEIISNYKLYNEDDVLTNNMI